MLAGEPGRQHATIYPTEAVEPLLGLAMGDVPGDYAIRISESVLGADERNAVLALVIGALLRIPVEARPRHSERLA